MSAPNQIEESFIRELFGQSIKQNITGLGALSGDASIRKYYRVLTKEKSFIVCIDLPDNLIKKDFNFLSTQEILKENNIPVPQVYDVIHERGYVLLQDLGDQTLLIRNSFFHSLQEEFDEYSKICRCLAEIPAIKTSRYNGHSIHRRSFDMNQFSSEIQFTNQNFIEGLLNHQAGEASKKIYDLFATILKEILEEELVLVHRDFHSRNIMITKNEHPYIIDFQDARRGPIQYDLASLLEDAYYNLDKNNKDKLIEFYFNIVKDSGIYKKSFQEFQRYYHLCAIQRIYKAIGTFCFILKDRQDFRYLRYIHSSFENLKKILFLYPEYKNLRLALGQLYYEY